MQNLELVGEDATAKIYRDGDRAVKVYLNASMEQVEAEAGRQSFAAQAGLPVPSVYGVRSLGEAMIALDMQYISGTPLLYPKMDREERLCAIQTLVRLQCRVHGVNAKGFPRQEERILWKIKHNDRLEKPVKEKLLSLLNSMEQNEESLCHGDFHALNILYDGTGHWIIDWVDASVGSPLGDACRTYLLFRQYISRSAEIYLRLFCKEAGVLREDVLRWLPLVAAVRLSENMDEKARAVVCKIIEEWDEQTKEGTK